MIEFLLYHVPWWAYAILAGLVVLGLAYLFHVDSRHLITVAVLLAAAIFSAKMAQGGWKAKEQADMREAEKAVDRATKAREKQKELNNDPKNLRAHDRYERDD
jgi:hypothetical protein